MKEKDVRKFATGLSEIKVGGSYFRFIRMIRALAGKGFEITVFSTSPVHVRHPKVHWKQVANFSPDFLRTGVYLFIYPFLMIYLVFFKDIKEIIAYGPVYATLLSPVRLCKNCRIYCMVRGMLSSEYSYQGRSKILKFFVSFFEKMGVHVSHRIIVVSRSLGERIRESTHIRRDKIVYLPNEIPCLADEKLDASFGVKVWRERLPDDGLRLFSGGVFTAIKNYELLIRTAALLKIPFHVCFAGRPANQQDEAYFIRLRSEVQQLNLKSHVSWLGWLPRDQLLGVLASSHLFLGASHHEGMSNIFLEALALDVPCMAMKTPDSEELMCSEDLLFESTEELAGMITRFYNEKEYSKKITLLCQRVKEKWTFDWEEKLLEALS